MDGACVMYGGRKDVNTGFCWGNLWERGNLEYLRVYERVILKWAFKK